MYNIHKLVWSFQRTSLMTEEVSIRKNRKPLVLHIFRLHAHGAIVHRHLPRQVTLMELCLLHNPSLAVAPTALLD